MKIFFLYFLFVGMSCKQRSPLPIAEDSSGKENNIIIKRGDSLYCKVIKITDGDTFKALFEKNTFRIRMNAIDCPERKQDFYKVAKDALGDFIFDKEVKLVVTGHDRYGRVLADVFLNNQNINLAMVEGGFAWHYKKFSSSQEYTDAENRAKLGHKGLWSMPNPVAPWDFR